MRNTGLSIWSAAGAQSKAVCSPCWQERDEGMMEDCEYPLQSSARARERARARMTLSYRVVAGANGVLWKSKTRGVLFERTEKLL